MRKWFSNMSRKFVVALLLSSSFMMMAPPAISQDFIYRHRTTGTDRLVELCDLPWGGKLRSGDQVSAYLASELDYGEVCSSQVRTCKGKQLSGSFEYPSCSVLGLENYDLVRTNDVPNGTFHTVGCSVYENTDRKETYKRDDGSEFVVDAGAGSRVYRYGNDQHLENNVCVANSRTVPISYGTRYDTWNGTQWVVSNVTCASGYVRSGNSCIRKTGTWVATSWGYTTAPHCYYDTGHSTHWYGSPTKACYVGEQCFVLQVEPKSDSDKAHLFTCR
ncbi:hypothetical protein TH5_00405 [Thalassospira xianhensis MCCC 1A02616]|uniref:Uncharacterized protein n=1 Tax=Thalassospira xianhensis MCCC 1A02616 TaxID=1177929 RepID=A0A367UHT6_9PROT|nr:hypothetical protein TH5_00405 [Thalassospira xianhensis MCCC 1A02616]